MKTLQLQEWIKCLVLHPNKISKMCFRVEDNRMEISILMLLNLPNLILKKKILIKKTIRVLMEKSTKIKSLYKSLMKRPPGTLVKATIIFLIINYLSFILKFKKSRLIQQEVKRTNVN